MTTPWQGRTIKGEVPGRVGGLARSRAKAAASRKNGKLGGRPKNKTKLALAEERARTVAIEAEVLRAEVAALRAQVAAMTPPPPPDKRPAPTVDRFGLIELE
jgi:hypothetical protein